MKRFIELPEQKVYDILVVGGGITGAAVAYEAASRGYTVALVDKGDFGAATSAATSKLIHGGLRYLANFEYKLVRESLKERRILENIAPNLVYPVAFIIPTYQGSTRSRWLLEIGMILYDLLSYDKGFTWDKSKKIPPHCSLSRQKLLEMEPVAKTEGLTGAVMFYDCASFAPERLTLAFIKSAVRYGAHVSNYTSVDSFVYQPGRVSGIVVNDLLNHRSRELHGRLIINCAGPWADMVLAQALGKEKAQHIRRSEGIHLITRRLTNDHCIAVQTAAGRGINVIPWRGHALIGTTDREYVGDPDHYQVTRQKIEDFLAEINSAVSSHYHLQYCDITHAYGGLRPLIDDQTEDTYKSSRKYEIYDNQADGLDGLLTVEGGKYTTSRNLAENVLKVVEKKLGGRQTQSVSAKTFLNGCDISNMNQFITQSLADYPDFPAATIDYLARLYGTELSKVIAIARSAPELAQALNADGEMPAQVVYAVRYEMARTLVDILTRRTGIGTLGHPGRQVLETVAGFAAEELKWDAARLEQELAAADKLLALPE